MTGAALDATSPGQFSTISGFAAGACSSSKAVDGAAGSATKAASGMIRQRSPSPRMFPPREPASGRGRKDRAARAPVADGELDTDLSTAPPDGGAALEAAIQPDCPFSGVA